MEGESKQIAELKELVRRNIALTEETHRMVHSMNRAAWWSSILRWGWWVIVFGISGVAYYYYVQPAIQKIENAYHSAQSGVQQAQDWQTKTNNFFKGIFGGN